MRIVHLTDPHLSQLDDQRFWALTGKRRLGYLSWMRRRRHRHRRDILARIAAGARAEGPDLVAVTGDLVQLGLAGEIDEAAQWLASFAPPRWCSCPATMISTRPIRSRPCTRPGYLGSGRQQPRRRVSANMAARRHHRDRLNSSAPRPSGRRRVASAPDSWRASNTACTRAVEPCAACCCTTRRCRAVRATQGTRRCARAERAARHGGRRNRAPWTSPSQRRAPVRARTRVLATASASNAARDGRASYRVLDIHSRADGWQVDATLKTLPEQGEPVRPVRGAWFFPR